MLTAMPKTEWTVMTTTSMHWNIWESRDLKNEYVAAQFNGYIWSSAILVKISGLVSIIIHRESEIDSAFNWNLNMNFHEIP